jgi:hypothetical protein
MLELANPTTIIMEINKMKLNILISRKINYKLLLIEFNSLLKKVIRKVHLNFRITNLKIKMGFLFIIE